MSIHLEIHKKLGEFSLDVNLHTQARRIGILGASGCGKSMTLKCIAGIEKPDQGVIRLDDRVLFDSSQKINPKPQKRNVGYLFQNYALFPTMTVRENISVGIKGSKEEKRQMVDRMIDKFQLQGLDRRLPMELSGGQQQRVALARIMAYSPDAILLDEPFSALDLYLKDRLQHELLDMLQDYDGTVIMVSHSRDEIYRFSQDLLIMDAGQTICSGNTREIFLDPQKMVAARLTGCKNIVKVKRLDAHHLQVDDWGVRLHLLQDIPESVTFIGIRAHDFIPLWGETKENSIPIYKSRGDELPFEKKYYIQAVREGAEDICWFVQKEIWSRLDCDGMPDSLMIPEEKLLLLQ